MAGQICAGSHWTVAGVQRISPARDAIMLPQWAIALYEERRSLAGAADSSMHTPQRLCMACLVGNMTKALRKDKSSSTSETTLTY